MADGKGFELHREAVFQYKVDNYYSREHDRGIAYDDPELGIDWTLKKEELVLSPRDLQNPLLKNAELFNGKTS